MVRAFCVEHWICDECGESHDSKWDANDCCKNEVKKCMKQKN